MARLWPPSKNLTHIIRRKQLSIRRVLEKHPLEPQQFKQERSIALFKFRELEFVDIVFVDYVAKDGIKTV